MKILQINVTANWGSTGRIAEEIGQFAISNGWESWIAYGRGKPQSQSNLIRIGNGFDMRYHGIQTRLFDNHGLASKLTTKKFIEEIKKLNPDIIHLHNIHGYFLNYKILFDYLKSWGGPVVWTLHDCWPFTGHCAFYSYIKCDRWQIQCHNCPQKKCYPASILLDRSNKNYHDKMRTFTGIDNLTIITVSNWLKTEASKSFFNNYPITTIYNGIDTDLFCPMAEQSQTQKKNILGVANVWDERKGLNDFLKLRKMIPDDYNITLVGLSKKQIKDLPQGINGITRTDNIQDLVKLYSEANVYVNTSKEETLGMTTLEALSCGTPAIVYNCTACPETLSDDTGYIVDNVNTLIEKIKIVVEESPFCRIKCRERVLKNFNKNFNYLKYIDIYQSLYSG